MKKSHEKSEVYYYQKAPHKTRNQRYINTTERTATWRKNIMPSQGIATVAQSGLDNAHTMRADFGWGGTTRPTRHPCGP
jgi:hypothetical protein